MRNVTIPLFMPFSALWSYHSYTVQSFVILYAERQCLQHWLNENDSVLKGMEFSSYKWTYGVYLQNITVTHRETLLTDSRDNGVRMQFKGRDTE